MVRLIKRESNQYKRSNDRIYIYNENGKRVYESVNPDTPFKGWKHPDTKEAIENLVESLEIKDTNDKGLTFILKDRKGDLKVNGYMLILTIDDGKGSMQFPIKNINNLKLKDVLLALKTLLNKRNIEVKNEALAYLPINNIALYNNGSLRDAIEDDELDIEETSKEPEDLDDYVYDDGFDTVQDLEQQDEELDDIEDELDNTEDDSDKRELDRRVVDKFIEQLNQSLLPCSGDINSKLDDNQEDDLTNDDCTEVLYFLSPSYAMEQMSNIVVPIRICFNSQDLPNVISLNLPSVSLPEAEMVFDSEYPEDAYTKYDSAIQDYINNDVSFSPVMPISIDNLDDCKARVIQFINELSEDYHNKKSKLDDSLTTKESSLLKESRYFIVPEYTDLESEDKVDKLTPMGFSDLSIAKNELNKLRESGKYDFDLKIMDTNFSGDKNKWEIL